MKRSAVGIGFFCAVLCAGCGAASPAPVAPPVPAGAAAGTALPAQPTAPALGSPLVAVGPEYDTTHVYVPPDKVGAFAASFLATFGGQSTKQVVVTVTPTPSSTTSQLLRTPVGLVSLFGFSTGIPFPFGAERTGYLVTDLDVAVAAAKAAGADLLVAPFPDPIGRDAVIQWPGGVNMQLYWHTAKATYPALATIPENRIYISADRVSGFLVSFLAFSHGTVVRDDAQAPGIEIGRAAETYRRVRVQSGFGKLTLLVSDGHLPYPYGRESTGYEVAVLADTLTQARAAAVKVVVPAYVSDGREAALLEFPGGYIAEVHAPSGTVK